MAYTYTQTTQELQANHDKVSADIRVYGEFKGEYAIGSVFTLESDYYIYDDGTSSNYFAVKDGVTLPYTATEADPNNDVNLVLAGSASTEYVKTSITESEERLLGVGSSLYKGSNGSYVQNGDEVPVDTTHLTVLINGKAEDVRLSSSVSGVVADLTETSATVGGVSVSLYGIQIGTYRSTLQVAIDDASLRIGDYIATGGYYLAGDGGDGEYVVVDSGTGTANGGTFVDTTNGLQLRLINSGKVNLKQFGAKGDGVTSDNAAWVNFLASGCNDLYVPEGTFPIQAGQSFNAGALRLRGAGAGVSTLMFTTTSSNGLRYVANSADDFFDIGDFTVKVSDVPTGSFSAIWIDGSSQPDPGNLYGNIPITPERDRKRGIISRINFVPETATTDGFDTDIRVTGLLNYSITETCHTGPTDMSSTSGIILDGEGVCVDIRLRDIYMFYKNVALMMPDYVEAVYLSESEFVNVNTGVLGQYVAGRSVLDQADCGAHALKIGPSHVNAYEYCVYLENAPFTKITKCLFINQLTTSPAVSAGVCAIDSNWLSVKDCKFYSETGRASNMFGIIYDGVTNSISRDNTFQNYPVGYELIGTSILNTIKDSICYYNSAAVCVRMSSATVSQNLIGNCVSDGTNNVSEGSATSTRYELTSKIVKGTYTVTTASSRVSVTVAIDSGTFSVTPEYAHMEALGNSQLVYKYDYDNSTATSLLFYGMLPDNSNISAGTYPYTMVAHRNNK